MSPSISIVVIEDDPVFRQNVSYLINETPGMACVHTYDSVTAFMANEPTTHNDLYWVDINLPGGSGIELVRHLHTKNPEVRCLICSLHDDDHHVFEAMRAGASGYLLKNASVEQMLAAIHELMAGGAPMSPYIARKLIDTFKETPKPAATASFYGLSERELEVLQHIAKGLLYKEVADALHISIETVKKHLRSIYTKLQVQNRTEAVIKFLGKK